MSHAGSYHEQQIECRRFDRTPNIRFQPSAASAIVSRRG
jgi:hypothetical protein